ncbi:progonadoliberin-1-like [Centropristis striata]|uniref:progonadoliberin-1-like n=1 Tax=Centropristis striata TaxID=184440 RepID=UPI0027E21526|nr:progonadoliberin-1-like [Centropristis striata]
MNRRMATTSFALWLLLVGAVLPQGCCQHWSFGLSPGGKRDLDGLSDTLGSLVEGFPHMDTPCSVFGCAEESPFAEIYRTKGFLGSVTDRKNGHGTYKK